MAVLVPRIRTIGVRLSEDEYSSLERFCAETGARSISDLARAAICSFIRRGDQENTLALAVNQNVARVEELQKRIAKLSAEIALFRASSAADKSDEGREAQALENLPKP